MTRDFRTPWSPQQYASGDFALLSNLRERIVTPRQIPLYVKERFHGQSEGSKRGLVKRGLVELVHLDRRHRHSSRLRVRRSSTQQPTTTSKGGVRRIQAVSYLSLSLSLSLGFTIRPWMTSNFKMVVSLFVVGSHEHQRERKTPCRSIGILSLLLC